MLAQPLESTSTLLAYFIGLTEFFPLVLCSQPLRSSARSKEAIQPVPELYAQSILLAISFESHCASVGFTLQQKISCSKELINIHKVLAESISLQASFSYLGDSVLVASGESIRYFHSYPKSSFLSGVPCPNLTLVFSSGIGQAPTWLRACRNMCDQPEEHRLGSKRIEITLIFMGR